MVVWERVEGFGKMGRGLVTWRVGGERKGVRREDRGKSGRQAGQWHWVWVCDGKLKAAGWGRREVGRSDRGEENREKGNAVREPGEVRRDLWMAEWR